MLENSSQARNCQGSVQRAFLIGEVGSFEGLQDIYLSH